ncbi:hypothetical protein RUM44_004469 [Polyplax serrata]|uniref:Major facilitator superfamily (MFS) profile domain-containing protein n=1 Tax=Polyplax serrata TaxID=468196 RepID=A0ABR1B2Z4_POLSC
MTFQIPVINLEVGELKDIIWAKLQEPHYQRRLVLIIVSVALLLDNMLYMVIVPIIPDYLRYIGAYAPIDVIQPPNGTQGPVKHDHHGQDTSTGVLFASKAIVQLMINPFSGALIDRIGYDIPMMIGLTIMFLSTAVFACGRSYGLLFFARSLQGVGSAFADTSGLAMIADRFTEEAERSKALGIALAFISFGCLVAPPFGGALYQFAGKEVPFLILAFISLADGFMLLLVMKPLKTIIKEAKVESPDTIPIWRLLMDPYIAVCAGALMMSNVALAFLEPTISLWMEDNLTTDNWKIGMIWLPAFFPHVIGVVVTVKMAKKYPRWQWAMAAGGLALEGMCCFIIPFSGSYKMLMLPICGICFGIALIDTALLPMLGYLVDVRYVSVYGSIYAIADISYSIAYAVGPIIAGGVVEAIGFTALNFLIAFANLFYAPVLMYLKNIYDFKPFQNEANILMSDPPAKEYQTYSMQDQRPVNGDYKNHLDYGRMQDTEGNYAETTMDSSGTNSYQSYNAPYSQNFSQSQPGYQQGGGYQAQESTQSYSRPSESVPNSSYQQAAYQQDSSSAMRRGANPFRQADGVSTSANGNENKNPFRGGAGF